ncbi:phosphoribosyltransferase family protein [Streptomyces sp. SAJ15]|uniref:phosphoribosyltransferase family protein n=1 Tax=Streptomyces sp. SAJ15 TaxID=2011095 RepID=UPI0021B3E86F|nr:alpha/beta family hydrolase [Streptomyces sp. SAJ15]
MWFNDRTDAGRRLAGRLEELRSERPIVVGLPRGGVPVAFEVARALDAPLDVIIVRKLGVPYHRELGFGAIGEGGARVVHEDIVRMSRVDQADLAEVERTEEAELGRQAERFRGGRERIPLSGRVVILVDDGIATGATAEAACRVARAQGAARVVLAVPVAPPDAAAALRAEADEVVCLSTPSDFFAVGEWYRDFSQTSDSEVMELLHAAAAAYGETHAGTSGDTATPEPRPEPHAEPKPEPVAESNPPPSPNPGSNPGPHPGPAVNPGPGAGPAPASGPVRIPVEGGTVELAGDLELPGAETAARSEGGEGAPAGPAPAIVVFAHGSGSSRHSPRNRSVAERLNRAGLGTLLFDLLTAEEEIDRANVFDIETLGRRLAEVTRWLRTETGGAQAVCYFGASTGAAAALRAAAAPGADIAAVVSRGGRPDLAGERLADVTAPTLLIVGGRDETVLDLNRQAQAQLRCENRLTVVPGATHLFEEPGALRKVADLAWEWFSAHS